MSQYPTLTCNQLSTRPVWTPDLERKLAGISDDAAAGKPVAAQLAELVTALDDPDAETHEWLCEWEGSADEADEYYIQEHGYNKATEYWVCPQCGYNHDSGPMDGYEAEGGY